MIDWTHWHNEPYLIGGLVLLGWLWALLAGPLRAWIAPGQPFPRRQARFFYAALVLFYLSVGSPLDQMGERFLFSAHMLQHQLLIYPTAILFLSGLPAWMVDPLLGYPAWQRLLRFLFHPIVCALVYALTISVWHMPTLYEWALQNKVVHVLEHGMFFGCALIYWWPMLSPSLVHPPRSYALQMVYFFLGVITMTPVFAFITFSHEILYPTYEFAPRIFPTFTAGNDQLLAGVMMQLVGVAVAMSAFGVAFFRWSKASEAGGSPPAR